LKRPTLFIKGDKKVFFVRIVDGISIVIERLFGDIQRRCELFDGIDRRVGKGVLFINIDPDIGNERMGRLDDRFGDRRKRDKRV